MNADLETAPEKRRGDASLQRIQQAVMAARGLDLSYYKHSFLRRRLAIRQRALQTPTLGAYAGELVARPGEMDRLVKALTVNVSEFFRNPDVFAVLENQVIPPLWRRASVDERPLRCWSAGCATGEEIYSVAILLDRARVPPSQAVLLATDIDREVVARAREGRFEASRLRDMAPDLLAEYWEPLADERFYRIRHERLAGIRFQVRDVMTQCFQRGLDLVLCRNLLIYIDMELQERLLHNLARSLRPGGVLVLGRVERLMGDVRAQFEAIDASERVYRKLASGA